MATFTRRLALMALPVLAVVACGAANGDNVAPETAGGAMSVYYDLGFVKGDPKAPLTVIEYASPTCPTCKYFHDDILPALEEKYVATGKVKFVFREYPIHGPPDIEIMAIARCVGPEKFFDVVDDVFENQSGLVQAAQAGALRSAMQAIGKRHGIETPEAFEACRTDPKIRAAMAEVYEEGQKHKVDGTPTFVIDGKVRNWGGDYTTVEGFSRQFDALLAEKGVQ